MQGWWQVVEQDGRWPQAQTIAQCIYKAHLESAVTAFSAAMRAKMELTSRKGTWRGAKGDALKIRLVEERREVDEVFSGRVNNPETARHLQAELVDEANTCLMLHDWLEQKILDAK